MNNDYNFQNGSNNNLAGGNNVNNGGVTGAGSVPPQIKPITPVSILSPSSNDDSSNNLVGNNGSQINSMQNSGIFGNQSSNANVIPVSNVVPEVRENSNGSGTNFNTFAANDGGLNAMATSSNGTTSNNKGFMGTSPMNNSVNQGVGGSSNNANLQVDGSNPFDIGFNNNQNINNSSMMGDSSVQQMPQQSAFNNNAFAIDNNSSNNQVLSNDTGYSGNGDSAGGEVVSVGSYMLFFFLMVIPVVNIIYIIYQAVAGKKKNLQNLSRAMLIWWAIGIAIMIVFLVVLNLLGLSFTKSITNSSFENTSNNVVTDNYYSDYYE